MTSFLIRTIAGPRTKYIVLVFWLVVVVAAAPFASKLTGSEHNDTKAWLPGSAESTKVIDLQAAFQSPNVIPAVVIYERHSGLTAQDKVTIVLADARRLADGCQDQRFRQRTGILS